jgi:hypothetical protein
MTDPMLSRLQRDTTRCCSRHHYTCCASFDEFPPEPCCPSCPCGRHPIDPLPFPEAL